MIDVQHLLLDASSGHPSDVELCFQDHSIAYNRRVLGVTAEPCIDEQFSAMHMVYKECGRQTLLEICMVVVLDSRHGLKVLIGSRESGYLELYRAKEQIKVSNMYKKDDSLLSPGEIIMLKRHKDSFLALFNCDSRLFNTV